VSFQPVRPGRFEIQVRWPHPNPGIEMSEAQLEQFFQDRAHQYLYSSEWFLRPSVEGDNAPPSALMTWWLLLYSFSMLARYQPAKWVGLLAPDSSRYAAALSYALHTALDVIPQLVLEALDRRPFLLQKHIRL